MNHCGWIICPYNSEYDKDFDLTDGYCKQDKKHCELRDNPKKALKEILTKEEAKKALDTKVKYPKKRKEGKEHV